MCSLIKIMWFIVGVKLRGLTNMTRETKKPSEMEQIMDEISQLETRRKFIDPFFMGETKHEYELTMWKKQADEAYKRLAALKEKEGL